MRVGGLGLLGRGWGLRWRGEGSVRGAVGNRLRGSIRVGGFGGLILTVWDLVLVTVTMLMKVEVVLIRGGMWRCGVEMGCRRAVRCLRLRFRMWGGC